MSKLPTKSHNISNDASLFQDIQEQQTQLQKQALEVFHATEKYDEHAERDEQGAHTSRQLLESLTTGKSFSELYDEAVNEQEKQRLLTTQISQTITNEQLTFEQKKDAIDQLEQSCGNKMYVIAFNTLIEEHAISPCFSPEYYQQLITIDTEIQARRDLEISDFMQMISDLMQTSTTVTDPIARQDIVLKMWIIMILWSGINVRKIHEAELMRLKQEFASLFFEIPPGKNGSGTKKLLRTIMKSYTSIELNADLHRIYPPLEKFVEMIDQLLEISKHKEPDLSYAWKNFAFMHHAISTMHRDKMANVIDNVIPAELYYTGDVEHMQKLWELRNVIQHDPKKLQDYFMLLHYIVDAREDAPKISDSLGDLSIADSFKYTVANTQRQRSLQEIYNFDVQKVCPEVAQILAWNSTNFPFPFFLETRWRDRCVEHLTKEWVLRHIRSRDSFKDHLDLKSLIKKVWLDTLKADKDGMWILMKCMTEKLKWESYDTVQIDSYGNVYRQLREEINERERVNIPSPDRERVWTSIDDRSIHFDNESVIATGEYVTTREKAYTWYQKLSIYKDFIRVFVKEGHKDDGEIIWEVANDCFVLRKWSRHEICRRGKHHPGTIYYKDSDVILSWVSDGWIREQNSTNKTITFIDINLDEQLSFSVNEYKKVGEFHEGLARCTKNETARSRTYGFIDKTGKEVIPCEYDRVSDFSEWVCAVRKDGAYYFINQQGKIVFRPDEYFQKIYPNAISNNRRKKYYIDQAHPFSCGFTRVEYKTKMHPARFGEQWYPEFRTRFFDKHWKQLKFPGSMIITAASDFCGWIAKVQLQDGSRGLIDTFGNFYPVSG